MNETRGGVERGGRLVTYPVYVAIFAVLLALRLAGAIDWAWGWVVSPLLFPYALFVVIFLLGGINLIGRAVAGLIVGRRR